MMTFVSITEIRGIRYGLDTFGWVWREYLDADPGEPRWLRTGFSTFKQVERLLKVI